MDRIAKYKLIEIYFTIIGTVGILAFIIVSFYISYFYFSGWNRLWSFLGQICICILIYHIYRWIRYPGLFYSISNWKLTLNVLLSFIFVIVGIPLLTLLARLHLGYFIQLRNIGEKLGLEFKYKMRQQVRIKQLAQQDHYPGRIGWIDSIRVVNEQHDRFGPSLLIGTVLYQILFEDESKCEVEESEIA